MMRIFRILEPFIAISLYLTVILVIFYPAFFPPTGKMLFGDDVFRSYGFFRQFFAMVFNKGSIPWWNPYLFSGTPFLANPSLSFFYPPNWLILFLDKAHTFPILFAFHMFMGMLGVHWLGRRVIGSRSTFFAAWGGGIVYGLCGFFAARIWSGHVETLAAAAWVPWVVGSMWLAMETPVSTRIIKAGVLLAIQIYAGYQTVALFTLEIVGICALILVLYKRSFRPIAALGISIFIGIGLSALQLIPNFQFFSQSVRTYQFPYSWASYGSIIFGSLKQLAFPFIWGDEVTFHGPPPNYGEQASFVGITSLVLCGFAIFVTIFKMFGILKRDNREELWWVVAMAVIALFSIWIALGTNVQFDLFHLVWKYIPLYKNLRFPARQLMLLEFAIASMTIVGIAQLRIKVFQIIAVILLLIELVPFAKHFIQLQKIPESTHDRSLITLVTQDHEPYRLLQNFATWIPERDALNFDAAPVYGIFSANGYDPSILRSYYEFADSEIKKNGTSILDHNVQIPYLDVFSPYFDYLNIKYLMHPIQYDPIMGMTTERFKLLKVDPERGYRVYENLQVRPRFMMVKTAKVLSNRTQVMDTIKSGAVNLRETVLFSQDEVKNASVMLGNCRGTDYARAQLVKYEMNKITFSTDASCNAYLVTSEVYYPGWEGYIDGKKIDVVNSNLAFRTLVVPSGKHTVIMSFNPVIFLIGGVVSLVFLSGCSLFLLLKRD